MSLNQSRAEKSDAQLKKPGRSVNPAQQRNYSGAGGKGSGAATAPPPSGSSSASLSSSRSFRKSDGNVQIAHPRAAIPTANSGLNVYSRPMQNGTYSQSKQDAAVLNASKQAEASASRNFRTVPKSPSSDCASGGHISPSVATLPKGDSTRAFPLQFGSISPGFINGMQIPARTSSAPPNLDEQKCDQAHRESLRETPAVSLSVSSKQQDEKKDITQNSRYTVDPQQLTSLKHDVSAQVPVVTCTHPANQKSLSLPTSGVPVSLPMPYQEPQIPIQIGSASAQVQSQGVMANSLQMHVPLSIGSASQFQPPIFGPSLQSHHLQPQRLMHQGQGLGFVPQIGHQLTPQPGNVGMTMTPQFSQQPGKLPAVRKTSVKIRRPDTHEEVNFESMADPYLDVGSSGLRPHPNVPSQSQPLPSFSLAHPLSYCAPIQSNSYTSSVFFQTPSSVPLASNAMHPTSAGTRYNYPVGQGGQTMSFMNATTLNPLPVIKSCSLGHETSESGNSRTAQTLPATQSTVQVTVRPPVVSHPDKSGGMPIVIVSEPTRKGELTKLPKKLLEASLSPPPRGNALGSENSSKQEKSLTVGTASVPSSVESNREIMRWADAFKDQQRQPSKKEATDILEEQQMCEFAADANLEPSLLKVSESTDETGLGDGGATSIPGSKKTTTTSELIEEMIVETSVSSQETFISLLTGSLIINDSKEALDLPKCTTDVVQEAGKVSQNSLHNSSDIIDETQPRESLPCKLSDPSCFPGNLTELETLDAVSEQDQPSTSPVAKNLRTERDDELIKEQFEKVNISSELSAEVEPRDTILASVGCIPDDEDMSEKLVKSNSVVSVTDKAETVKTIFLSGSVDPHKNHEAPFGDGLESEGGKESSSEEVGCADPFVPLISSSETKTHYGNGTSYAGPKDKVLLEQNRPKYTAGKKKKKRELLMKADAAGTNFDLYNAFKGPDQKEPEKIASSARAVQISSMDELKDPSPSDGVEKDTGVSNEIEQTKGELDDWEDAEISTPKLKSSKNGQLTGASEKCNDEFPNGMACKKKYSRDFLLTFSEQCMELPAGFEIGSDVVDALMSGPVGGAHLVDQEAHPGSTRIMDKMGLGSRGDRRGSAADDDRRNKATGVFSGRDPRMDVHGSGVTNFRPGQGGGHGVPRSSRGQPSGQYTGGILAGSIQSLASQGSMTRINSDADRWHRATGSQKGLIPSPQTSSQMMHKAEKKYEVGRAADEEELKQRKLKAILNKLTPQNFDRLFVLVKEVNIDNAITLTGVISQIFDKALMEPPFCEMYADFCFHLARELPDFNENNEKITFKRVLLNKCQEEFERGEREEAEADRIEEEGEVKLSKEEREEKKLRARRRTLGNIRLIGELYKKKMLTERIMHECIQKLLGQYQNPDEENVEALCKLMSTIGEIIDHPKAKEHMDVYFDMMTNLSTNQKLSSRVRFMLKDAIDLRKNSWRQRRKVEGPKKIEDVHRDAAQERQMQASRMARGLSTGSSSRRGPPPMDYGLRGMQSPGSQQVGGIGGFSSQLRGYGAQDVRLEDKIPFESRTLSVPLLQKPVDDDSITLGPQGGLGRGMSVRGQHSCTANAPLVENAGQRRIGSGSNGLDWQHPSYREEPTSRYARERYMGLSAYDHLGAQELKPSAGNKDMRNSDRSLDRCRPTSPAIARSGGGMQSAPPELTFSEEHLRKMSEEAIKEFYIARNEVEVQLCIKELHAPAFYPDMVKIWITDSFDRKKGSDRLLLAQLLINLCKPEYGLLKQEELIEGFRLVLSALEDAVTDSPRAAEYLGRIFAEIILENFIPFRDIGRLIQECYELQRGLASDVIVSILETVQQEKGESGLNEIRTSCKLEDFRPPDPQKAKRLDAFI